MEAASIKKLIITPDVSFKIAINIIGSTNIRMLFVVERGGRLIGSISDGDIRRAILNNVSFEHPVREIMHKSPRIVRSAETNFRDKAMSYILDEKLFAIPVVDGEGGIEDILIWYDFFDTHPHEPAVPEPVANNVIIMAGGKGERLDPFTRILPKPLIPLGDKPIVEKIMDNFHRRGFENFVLTLNYKKEIIKMYFKENRMPYNVQWIEEEEYLGTAGSLGLLRGNLEDTFFVCNCDTLLEYDFKAILKWHKDKKARLTVIGSHKEVIIPYGTIELDGGYLKTIREKPIYDLMVNTGAYVMEPEVLDLIHPNERIDMDELITRATKRWKVSVYPTCGGWFDVGQWKEYQDSVCRLENGKDK